MINITNAPIDTFVIDVEELGPFTSIRLFINAPDGGMDIRIYHMIQGREMIAIPAWGVSCYIDNDDAVQCLCDQLSVDDDVAESVIFALKTVYILIGNSDVEIQYLMQWEFQDGIIPSTIREMDEYAESIKKSFSYHEDHWLDF